MNLIAGTNALLRVYDAKDKESIGVLDVEDTVRLCYTLVKIHP